MRPANHEDLVHPEGLKMARLVLAQNLFARIRGEAPVPAMAFPNPIVRGTYRVWAFTEALVPEVEGGVEWFAVPRIDHESFGGPYELSELFIPTEVREWSAK